MYITSAGIVDGYIEPKFGTHADGVDLVNGVPTRSIPVAWNDIPVGTITLALVMQDYDAVPVCGFSWIHWLAVNIDPARKELTENASRIDNTFIQGKNSLASRQICGDMPESVTNYYSGPRPPDKDHEYEITVYALDCVVNLKNGFRLNELMKAIRGHILDSASLQGIYRA